MDDEKLWENFKKTGSIADYLRYRGVDIYAATNAIGGEEQNGGDKQTTGRDPYDRGPRYS